MDQHLDSSVQRWLVGAVGVAGFVMLVAYLFDMHANASCKGRLRGVMHWMECGILTTATAQPDAIDLNQAGYWHFLAQRRRGWFEHTIRGIFWFFSLRWLSRRRRDRPLRDVAVTKFFLVAGFVYVLVWPIITLMLALADRVRPPS